MKEELIDTINMLLEKIEEQEMVYQLALQENKEYNILKSIRTQIGIDKDELSALELQLLDQLPSRKK
jgi:hypothetical protein